MFSPPVWKLSTYKSLIEGQLPHQNISELKESIMKMPLALCNEISWSFMGISFALYNSFIQLVLLIINSKYKDGV